MLVGSTTGESVKVSKSDTAGGSTVVYEKKTQGTVRGDIPISIPRAPRGMFLTSIDADTTDGVVSVRYTFQSGPQTAAQSGGGVGSSKKTIKAITGATQSAPITMHPDFTDMYKIYGKEMRGGVVEWLDNAPSAGGALSVGSSSVNPMAGVQVYNKATAIYSHTKFCAGRNAVNVAINQVGKLSNPPGAGGVNQWLSCGASITNIGGDYRIDEKWIRDDRGFLADLYS